MKIKLILLISNKQRKIISFLHFFKFADKFDIILILIGTIASIGNGAALPIFTIFWGEVTASITLTNPYDAVFPVFLKFIYLSVSSFFASFLMMACWMISG